MIDQAQKLREMAKNAGSGVGPSVPVKRQSGSHCVSIAVTSGKGGVGKTTFSLALASSLAKLHKRVLLMDADLGLANVHILLGLAPRFNISHVISGECGIGDIVMEAAPGVHLVPGASGLEKLANLDIGRLERLRMDFMELESNYDYLIMDTGAGIGSNVTGFARHADLVLLIVTPDPSSCVDAYAMVKTLYDKGNTNIAVAVNMASSEQGGRKVFDGLNKLVVNYLKKPVELYAILLNDEKVLRLGRNQAHLAGQSGDSQFYRLTSALARKIAGIGGTGADGGFFSRVFKDKKQK